MAINDIKELITPKNLRALAGGRSPRLPIQTPILNRFGDMLFMNRSAAVKIGNGAGRKAEKVGDQLKPDMRER